MKFIGRKVYVFSLILNTGDWIRPMEERSVLLSLPENDISGRGELVFWDKVCYVARNISQAVGCLRSRQIPPLHENKCRKG